MREMKDSGVEWIGSIPTDWRTIRIKNIASLAGRIGWQGLTSDEYTDEGAYLITGTDFCKGKINWNSCVHVPISRWEEASQIQIKEGDLLITKDGTVGKVAIAEDVPAETSLNSGVLLIRCSEECDTKFLFWMIQSEVFWKWFGIINAGNSTIIHLYQHSFNNFGFPFPDIRRQKVIASFLDTKCSKIDAIIEKQQAIIEKLKEYKLSLITEAVTKGINPNVELKESGVNGIGLISADGIPTKIKYICNTQGRIGFKGYTTADLVGEGEGAYTLGASHLKNGIIDLTDPVYISWDKYYESPEIMVHEGDILIVQRGSTIGKVAIVDKDYGEITINPSLVLINDIKMENKYLLYALSARYIGDYISLIGTTTAIPMISQKQINDLTIIIPPKEQQEKVIRYLDEKCIAIDKRIRGLELMLEKLCDYKKSLIYEVVTGKKEV